MEQFIDLGIFVKMVCGLTILLSKANATVKVLNIEPSSYTPFVILLIYFTSFKSFLKFISKFGSETKDKISPVFISINNEPPPVA